MSYRRRVSTAGMIGQSSKGYTMMKRLFYGGLGALLLAGSAQAADLGGNCCADLEERVAELEATVARKGNRKVTLEVSGHVNAAVITTDLDLVGPNGDNMNDPRIIDNDNSESRFRFKGAAKLSADWEAGFLMEIGRASCRERV